MSNKAPCFLSWRWNIGSCTRNYWHSKLGMKFLFGETSLCFAGCNFRRLQACVHGIFVRAPVCVYVCVCVHRCARQMSRRNGIISTITAGSQPAVTTTAWLPFGKCLAPATCRFHKPAIRHWAWISQHAVWNICPSVCVCVRSYVRVFITAWWINAGDRQMTQKRKRIDVRLRIILLKRESRDNFFAKAGCWCLPTRRKYIPLLHGIIWSRRQLRVLGLQQRCRQKFYFGRTSTAIFSTKKNGLKN